MNAKCPIDHTQLAHRGGFADLPRPSPTTFEEIGGRPAIERLVNIFYDRIAADPELEPVFGPHTSVGRGMITDFFEEWMGGDACYSQNRAKGQQRAHYPVVVTPRGASRWLTLLRESMETCDFADRIVSDVLKRLGPIARALVNAPESAHKDHSCRIHHYRKIRWDVVAEGDTGKLKALLADEPELVERRAGAGRTLLWEAARVGHREMVEQLIAQGSDVNAPGIGNVTYGFTANPETLVMMTPYCVAMSRKHKEVADALLAHGAVIDLYTASFLGDKKRVEAFLAESADAAAVADPAEDYYAVTPFHHAICGKQKAVAQLLIDHGGLNPAHSDALLTLAQRRSAFLLAELLLKHGATADRSHGLVERAAHAGKVEWVRLLMEHGADATRVGVTGKTLIESPELAERLLKQGARAVGIVRLCNGNQGNRGDRPDQLRALLDHGVDMYERNYRGWTPLHVAAKSGFAEYVDILLEYGASLDETDYDGLTPLDIALERGNTASPTVFDAQARGQSLRKDRINSFRFP
ncbi:MAG: ankyrin repeat domain-containing protein [Candidatus Poribacteria bacterium]|nr:ankyrin repeat domain-containing protein [Candidatus Poribacteria bacterium]